MKNRHFYSIPLIVFLCFSPVDAYSLLERVKNSALQAANAITYPGDKAIGYVKEKGAQLTEKITETITGKVSFLSKPDPNGCNGFFGLCSRRYNEVAYVHAHNATTRGPSVVNNQDISLSNLLSRGVRSIKIPIHWAVDMGNQKGEGPTVAHGIYRPTLYKHYYERFQGPLLKKLRAFFDKFELVIKVMGGISIPGLYMKLRDIPPNVEMYIEGLEPIAKIVEKGLPVAYGNSTTPPGAKIPFTPCTLDPAARPLENVLKEIKTFLDSNPREVFTIMLEHTIPIDVIGVEFQKIGLDRYAHVQDKAKLWPTLQEMVESGKRLVVFGSPTPTFPWILDRDNFFFETPYKFSSKSALAKSVTIKKNRNYEERNTPPKNKLCEISHFLTIGLAGLPGAADAVNKRSFLRKRVITICETQKVFPNFIGTDFTQRPHGDVFDVVDEINGMGTYAGKPLIPLKIWF